MEYELEEHTSSLDYCVPICLAEEGCSLPCKKRVYERDRGTGLLVLKNDIKAEVAYVYLDDIEEIEAYQLQVCMADNIRELYVYRMTERGRYEHDNTINLRVLKPKKKPANDSLLPILIIILLVFLIIVLACCVIYYDHNARTQVCSDIEFASLP